MRAVKGIVKITRHHIILFVYIGAFAILSWLFGAATLPMLASIATLLSLTLVPLLYFLNTIDERTRISKNLYGEMTDTLDTLKWRDDENLGQGIEVIVNGNEKLRFTNKFLNHDVYDSLVSSGKINILKHELQQQVQNIFKMIKYHNEYLSYTSDNSNRNAGMNLMPYYSMIDEYEQDLLKQIPDMLEKLKREFPHIIKK